MRDYLAQARTVRSSDYAAAQARCAVAQAEAEFWLSGFDALLTPSAPDEAPEGYASTGTSTFNRAWTLLGVPCVSVPGATGLQGLPMGLQLVAPRGADARLLALAAQLEHRLPC